MKKIFIILLMTILFIPYVVNAEENIFIDSIEPAELKGEVVELEEATANDKTVNLNLRMSNIDDEIRYKLDIKNDTEEDYEINKNSITISSDYIDYSLESNNNNIIKSKTSKTVYLRVKYSNEVDQSKFVNGVYQDNITMKLNLRTNDDIPNPNTGLPYLIIISLILIISGIALIVFKKKKLSTLTILIGIILLPIGVKALKSYEITIDSKVKIMKVNNFCVYYRTTGEPIIKNYSFFENETFKQYLERNPSKYDEFGLNSELQYSNGECSTNTIMFGTPDQLSIANLDSPYYDTVTTIKYPEDVILKSDEGCYFMKVNSVCS